MQGRHRDETKLSTKPSQIRNRLRRKHGRLEKDIELYIEHGGMKPLHEWDLEELSRGRPRNKMGTFGGRVPEWITPAVVREAKRRLLEHAYGTMAGHLDLAIKTVAKLITSEERDGNGRLIIDPSTKLQAAKFIIEHIVGKPKAIIEVEGDDLVRKALAQALILDDGEEAHPVIDGQFAEEEDDDDEDEE